MRSHCHCLLMILVTIFTLTFSGASSGDHDDFKCPEEFGYYKHPKDCSKYYVCVFGGPLLESCTGGLMYSHELQTCDWPRNVVCRRDTEKVLAQGELERIPRRLIAGAAVLDEVDLNSAAAYDNFGQKKVSVVHQANEQKVNEPSDTPAVHDINTEKSSIGDMEDDTELEPVRPDAPRENDEDLLTAKSTELQHSPSVVYETKDSDVNLEFYDDYDLSSQDDVFYYVSWKDPIYDYSAGQEHSFRKAAGKKSSNNVTVDYSRYPQRPGSSKTVSSAGSKAVPCDAEKCQLPDCTCGNNRKLTADAKNLPQLVMLTFDDSVSDLNKNLYKDIFRPHRQNPNGCPIRATFYVSHEWTDYSQVQNLYADGHEVASHSISHSFGEQFSKRKWMKEMVGQRELLAAFAGISIQDIRGMRAPFLAIGGDNMFEMMFEANFTYDSSMPIYENSPPPYPYTLDYKMAHECMIPPCPEKSYPGLWEVPLVMWNDLGNGKCSMADACSNPSTAEDVYKLLMQNFQRHYSTNRAPFGLFYHAAWFTQPHHKIGFETFLDSLMSLEDVWLVTTWQTIQFLRSLSDSKTDPFSFEPFQCNKTEKIGKYCFNPKVCNLWHKSGVRYMRTCQECPSTYPWTGDTGISNSLADQLVDT